MKRYDPDFDYVNQVLKNKLGFTDKVQLQRMEIEMSQVEVDLLIKENVFFLSEEWFCYIHKRMFQHLYDFAGSYRKVNMFKEEHFLFGRSVDYTVYQCISKEVEAVLEVMKHTSFLDMSLDERCIYLVDVFSKLWKIHPFREGNTRTIVVFFDLYLRQFNIFGFYSFVWKHYIEVYIALALASFSNDELEVRDESDNVIDTHTDLLVLFHQYFDGK